MFCIAIGISHNHCAQLFHCGGCHKQKTIVACTQHYREGFHAHFIKHIDEHKIDGGIITDTVFQRL